MRTLHQIEIDIFGIPYRPCRPYQERIADYYNSGRPRFEWEKIRQKNLMEGDQTIVRVCGSCNLNILGGPEGCRIQVENLGIFVGAACAMIPQTSLVRYTFQDDIISAEDTRFLHQEFLALAQALASETWPIAQIFDDGEPRPSKAGSIRPHETFEWGGNDEHTFIFSNAGYTVAIGRTGIVVRESLGEPMPDSFSRLWKEGASVFGETVGGRIVPFLPIKECLPAWDDSRRFVPSELRYMELPLLEVFGDIVDSFIGFSQVAISHNTGLKVSLL